MNPLTLYQAVLDTVSQAIMAGDFDSYARTIDLPYLVQTNNARHLITQIEDLRSTFDALSQGLARRGVTHYERIVREADYVHRDRIQGSHYTHLIANGERVLHPKLVCQAIVRRGDAWLFSEACYPIDAPHWPLDDATIFANDVLSIPSRGAA